MKNLSNYLESDNIGYTYWFKTLMEELRIIGKSMKDFKPLTQTEVFDYGQIIQNISNDLIEWQETTNKPLFYRDSKDVFPTSDGIVMNPIDSSHKILKTQSGSFRGDGSFWIDELPLYYTALQRSPKLHIHEPGKAF